jgi:hypothetical protein
MLKVITALLVISKPLNHFAEVNGIFHRSPMPKKKKHAMELTDEEALKRIFHPEIVKAVRKHLKAHNHQSKKSVPKRKSQ